MANFLEHELRETAFVDASERDDGVVIDLRDHVNRADRVEEGANRTRRTQTDTLVVGSRAFGDVVLAAARRTGRRAVFCYPDDVAPAPPTGGWDELVLEASFGQPVPSPLLDSARSVIVVDGHEAQRAFDRVLPPGGAALKRLIDVMASALILLLVLPAMVVIGLAIRLDSPGPAIFRQERIGRNGRRFTMWKLRTMRTDGDPAVHTDFVRKLIAGKTEASDGVFKLANDPRVTRLGRMLRRTSLDEVPQLVNVLLGHMSLVGPRPPLEYETRLYDSATWRRLRVVPGLTGAWQVSGRSLLPFYEMVQLDVDYWRRWSIWRDLWILMRTPKAVFTARGAV